MTFTAFLGRSMTVLLAAERSKRKIVAHAGWISFSVLGICADTHSALADDRHSCMALGKIAHRQDPHDRTKLLGVSIPLNERERHFTITVKKLSPSGREGCRMWEETARKSVLGVDFAYWWHCLTDEEAEFSAGKTGVGEYRRQQSGLDRDFRAQMNGFFRLFDGGYTLVGTMRSLNAAGHDFYIENGICRLIK